MSYAMTLSLPLPFADAVTRVRDALAQQGFGVLTEIDVRATMKAKLDVDGEDYLILGACNPPLAHRALESDPSVGVLLPCNVVVRADGPARCIVEALDPKVIAELSGSSELEAVAEQASAKLQAALVALGQ